MKKINPEQLPAQLDWGFWLGISSLNISLGQYNLAALCVVLFGVHAICYIVQVYHEEYFEVK